MTRTISERKSRSLTNVINAYHHAHQTQAGCLRVAALELSITEDEAHDLLSRHGSARELYDALGIEVYEDRITIPMPVAVTDDPPGPQIGAAVALIITVIWTFVLLWWVVTFFS